MISSKINLLKFCKDIFTIPRSITGQGVRDTLTYINKYIPLKIKKISSGEKAFDWTIPPEWNINEAYIIDQTKNKKIIDFKDNTLHILGYSTAIDKEITFKELEKHLYFLKDLPDAIPYKTSYYEKRWGFSLSYNQYKSMDKNSKYRVVIDSSHNNNGELNYGELLIKGKSKKEIFLSTYICHPQMANNELSGIAVVTALANILLKQDNYYSYRFVFVPETIGSIAYISKNLSKLKKNVIGGFNITCVGDEKRWGIIPSRYGNNISDKIAEHILMYNVKKYSKHSWLDRGSDERQYCSPGVDLPICCITRSKWNEYPEYHTSLDNFNLVTKKGLDESLEIYLKCIRVFESNKNIKPKITVFCEPNLGVRGLHPTMKKDEHNLKYRDIKHFISYCDGTNSILEIADLCKIDFFEAFDYYMELKNVNLIK